MCSGRKLIKFNKSKEIMKVLVAQLCTTLCNPMNYSPPGASVYGYSLQEYWSGLPFPSTGDLPNLGVGPKFPALQADSLPLSHWGSPFSAYYILTPLISN